MIQSIKTPGLIRIREAEDVGAVMAFSTRQDGVSPEPFASFNFSQRHGDAPENVSANFHLLKERLQLGEGKILTIAQEHGDTVVILNSLPAGPVTADAVITARPGFYPAVKTADCLPILIVDQRRRISAAVHAGRRGTVLRIASKTVGVMVNEFGSDPGTLLVALGPCIGQCCYEVNEPVLKPFVAAYERAERFIRFRGHSRSFGRLDLQGANRWDLLTAGVSDRNIITVEACTHCRWDRFYSYRRDGAVSGRHISLVGFCA